MCRDGRLGGRSIGSCRCCIDRQCNAASEEYIVQVARAVESTIVLHGPNNTIIVYSFFFEVYNSVHAVSSTSLELNSAWSEFTPIGKNSPLLAQLGFGGFFRIES